ncbi:MAG: acetolactate synthase 2 catalytic subunit [Phycisphaerales bacterium]
MNGAELLIRCLEAEGVRQIWGYPGGAIMPVYDALLGSSITHYLTRHEQGAAFAAQGFARTSGRPGVCMATSGPGATNLVTAIADAMMDSVPLVAITGQVPSPVLGTDAFQEVDVIGVTMPIVKHSWLVESADDIPRIVREAFHLAAEGRPGPVLIDIPKDVQLAPTSGEPIMPSAEPAFDNAPDPVELARALDLIRRAERPVIYAGGGVRIAGAWNDLRIFAEATGAPVVHTLLGLGGVPGDHPQFVGMLGMHGNKAANIAVQDSDLLIAIGARFDDRVTGKLDTFAPGASVIHMDVDAAELGKLRRPHASLAGCIRRSMAALSIRARCDAWRERVDTLKREHAWRYDAPFESIYAPRLLRDLCARAPRDAYVCCDVGQHQMWVAQHWCFDNPRRHLTSGGFGTMGFGLPAAIGVKQSHPDATVICVSGDGSIMMNIQELATINRYGVGLKLLLLDNSALGMVRQWQELFFAGRESEVDLSDNPDFAELARAFGLAAISIDRADQTADAIDEFLAAEGPVVLHAKIDRHANVWPLVPPGKSNADMLDQPRESTPEPEKQPA